MNVPKIGLFSIGLDTYWPQFKGLKANLLGYHDRIKERLRGFGAEVVDAGLIETLPHRLAASCSGMGAPAKSAGMP
ncbi:MAG: hypothetical protein ACOYMV_12845 [Verrucomicrobiia bacterium]